MYLLLLNTATVNRHLSRLLVYATIRIMQTENKCSTRVFCYKRMLEHLKIVLCINVLYFVWVDQWVQYSINVLK